MTVAGGLYLHTMEYDAVNVMCFDRVKVDYFFVVAMYSSGHYKRLLSWYYVLYNMN